MKLRARIIASTKADPGGVEILDDQRSIGQMRFEKSDGDKPFRAWLAQEVAQLINGAELVYEVPPESDEAKADREARERIAQGQVAE